MVEEERETTTSDRSPSSVGLQDAHIALGTALMETGDTSEAIRNYRHALDIDPLSFTALLALGAALNKDQDFAGAAEVLRRAAECVPEEDVDAQAAIQHNLGIALHGLEYYEDAAGAFQKALHLERKKPFLPELHIALGECFYFTDRDEKALESFDRALALDRTSVRALVGKGNVLRLKRYSGALDAFERALVSSPENEEAMTRAGETLHELGRFDEALTYFDHALGAKFDDAWVIAYRADTLRQLGRVEEAIAEYGRAINLDPELDWAIALRAEALRQLGRADEALSELDQALVRNPGSASVMGCKAQILHHLNHFDEALRLYAQLIETRPDNPWAFVGKAELLRQTDRLEEAIATFDKALELEADHSMILTLRADALRRMGRYEEALAALDRVLEREPQHALATAYKGDVLRHVGRDEEALAAYTRALEIKPDLYWAVARRSETFGLLGRLPEALADADRAVRLKPNEDWCLYNRSLFRRATGDEKGARADLLSAISRAREKLQGSPHDRAKYFNLALYHLNVGDAEESARLCRKNLALGVSDHLIRGALYDLDETGRYFGQEAGPLRKILQNGLGQDRFKSRP